MYKLILIILMAMPALAAKPIDTPLAQDSTCYGKMMYSEAYLAILRNINTIEVTHLKMHDSTSTFTINEKRINDFEIAGDYLFILAPNKLYKVSLLFQEPIKEIDLVKSDFYRSIKIVDEKIILTTGNAIVEAYKTDSLDTIEYFVLQGKTNGITYDEKYIYISSDTTGMVNGAIHNSIFLLDRKNLDFVKETKIYSNPSGAMDIIGQDFYIGDRFYWRLDKKKIVKKDWISSYRRVFIPKHDPIGKPFRDSSELFYCERMSKTIRRVSL